jgi:hypothetical protein
VILITTDNNSLSGTIPTEIGQLTKLASLHLGKYDGCSRSLHALFFIFKLTTGSTMSSIYFVERGTEENELTGQIPIELQTLPLYNRYGCNLREYRVFPHPPTLPPSPLYYAYRVFLIRFAIVIIHIIEYNCFDSVAGFDSCYTSNNCG